MDPIRPAVTPSCRRLAAVAALVAVTACERAVDAPPTPSATAAAIAAARRDSIVRAQPGYVVDSVLPVEEALRRFRADLDAPDHFRGGAASRRALLARFAAAVEHRDITALRHLHIDRAEYAYLVYPHSASTRPPYRQAPQIGWMLLSQQSDKGLRRLLDRLGGRTIAAVDARCDATPRRDGGVTFWAACRVPVRMHTGQVVWMRLFGAIAERDGRYKFASYSSDL